MGKTNTIKIVGSVGCVVMAVVYITLGVMGLVNGQFPLGLQVEAFTNTTAGALILFLAAAADILTLILTLIVYNDHYRVRLISLGTVITGLAFVALIFVFTQQVLLVAIWLLGAAASVAALSACSDVASPQKVEKE